METSLVMSLLLTFSSNGWAHETKVICGISAAAGVLETVHNLRIGETVA
jgi:hypothetical protein